MVPIEAFRFNPSAPIREETIGANRVPILVADEVFADPRAAAAAARGLDSPDPHPGDFYPGLRYPLPEAFHEAFAGWLSAVTGRQAVSQRNGHVSVVTRPAAELLPIQTIPHFDTTDEDIFAAVLYLFEDGFGGTSFYRHRSTGLELLSARTEAGYRAVLRKEVPSPAALERRYRNGSDALFERIHSQQPRFNRLVLYPGRILHSGDIAPDYAGAHGPADGRLTITALCRLAGDPAAKR